LKNTGEVMSLMNM